MGERFWTYVRTYCLESSIVGLKYFYLYPDFFSRCFWTLNLVWVSFVSWIMAWLLFSRFIEMPTRITIENQFEPLFNLPYPAVTLCSPNQMTISSMDNLTKTLVNGEVIIDLNKTLPMLLSFYELGGDSNESDLRELQNVLELNRYSITEVMGKMPQQCDRFLKRCILEGKEWDCSKLFNPILTNRGYCCTFNSRYSFDGKNRIIDNPTFKPHFNKFNATGFKSLLTVIMDYEPEDALPETILNSGAIRIMLTDWTEFPVDYETYLVDTNGEAYLFLRATYTYCSDDARTLPPNSRNCLFETEQKYSLRSYFEHYHNSDCDHMCFVLAIQKTCHCWMFFLPTRSSRICEATHIPCIMDVRNNMSTWLTTEQCNCPRDCVSRDYRADLSIGNFDAIPYVMYSMNPYKGLQMNTSSSIMKIFFSSPVYVKQKQETVMSLINLVSNLGGVFGLFMGFSGISLLEIHFYFYKGMRDYVRSRYDQRRIFDYRR